MLLRQDIELNSRIDAVVDGTNQRPPIPEAAIKPHIITVSGLLTEGMTNRGS
jgi:hypothetical protein